MLVSKIDIAAKIRYKAREVSAHLTPVGADQAHLALAEPLRDITPGQSVVFYRGEQLLGGGIIERSGQD